MHKHLPEVQRKTEEWAAGLQPTGWSLVAQQECLQPDFGSSGQLAGSRVGKRMHYEERWYELRLDEVDDQQLNHI